MQTNAEYIEQHKDAVDFRPSQFSDLFVVRMDGEFQYMNATDLSLIIWLAILEQEERWADNIAR